jgi:dTDP-4-dehydrorhamnose reductase
MKAVLLGSKGQLGQDILAANERMNVVSLVALSRDDVDLSDLQRTQEVLGGIDFDVLISCASYHKTDEIESNAQPAMLMNGHLVRDLTRLCTRKGARFITYSTDYVFGGQAKRTPLTEDDGVAPVNVYGLSKAFGESLVAAEQADALVLRVSSLFGVAGSNGKGGNFVETMLRLGKQNGSLRVVNDQIMAPTGTADIAEATLRLIREAAPAGLYHVAGTGQASWWDFASDIVRRTGLNVPVHAVSTPEFPTPAARPPYSVLDNGKLAQATGWSMPHWEHALERYLRARGHIA